MMLLSLAYFWYMKYLMMSFILLSLCQREEGPLSLEKVKWIHGSPNCAENADPSIQAFRYNATTWIFRQNKCVHYEAPFIFLFVGEKKALLFDTGATTDQTKFPLYEIVSKVINDLEKGKHSGLELVVAHTHNHGDHRAADSQFDGKEKTTIIGLKPEDVISFFGLKDWPNQKATFDLGNRTIDIIPIPGHEPSSIAAYDRATKFLLTGDTFYPGRLYVRDWAAFRKSIGQLTDFASHHEISFILGNHIEMTKTPGVDYPVGTTYQPDELPLPLTLRDLQELNDSLIAIGDAPVLKVYNRYIVYPTR